jgi:hypothetical protein
VWESGGKVLRIQEANLKRQGSERILDFFGRQAIVGVPGFGGKTEERLFVEGQTGLE